MSAEQELCWAGIERWRESPDAHELRAMSWDDLGELAERGWEIGSHTCTHPHLKQLSAEELRDELLESHDEIAEHVGQRCHSLAYPYGEVDLRIAEMAGETGYLAGACLSHSLAMRGPHLWPRVGVFHDDFDLRFRLKVSPVSRSLRGSRLGRSGLVQPLRTETHRST